MVQLGARTQIAGIRLFVVMVEAGGLMAFDSYTPSFQARTAIYGESTLKGVNPSDLPAEQLTKFELFINMRTAKTLRNKRVLGPVNQAS